MSIDLPPLTAPSPARPRVLIILLWVLILGLAGLIMFNNAQSSGAQFYQKMVEDERFKMVGMLLVQMKSMERAGPASTLVRDQVRNLVKQMEDESRTPEDRVRTAILAGETLGNDEALQRLSVISGISNPATSEDIRSVRVIYEDGPAALPPDLREGLIRRHGYVGRLALAHGVPPDQEPRKTLEAEALRFTMRLTLVGGGLFVL